MMKINIQNFKDIKKPTILNKDYALLYEAEPIYTEGEAFQVESPEYLQQAHTVITKLAQISPTFENLKKFFAPWNYDSYFDLILKVGMQHSINDIKKNAENLFFKLSSMQEMGVNINDFLPAINSKSFDCPPGAAENLAMIDNEISVSIENLLYSSKVTIIEQFALHTLIKAEEVNSPRNDGDGIMDVHFVHGLMLAVKDEYNLELEQDIYANPERASAKSFKQKDLEEFISSRAALNTFIAVLSEKFLTILPSDFKLSQLIQQEESIMAAAKEIDAKLEIVNNQLALLVPRYEVQSSESANAIEQELSESREFLSLKAQIINQTTEEIIIEGTEISIPCYHKNYSRIIKAAVSKLLHNMDYAKSVVTLSGDKKLVFSSVGLHVYDKARGEYEEVDYSDTDKILGLMDQLSSISEAGLNDQSAADLLVDFLTQPNNQDHTILTNAINNDDYQLIGKILDLLNADALDALEALSAEGLHGRTLLTYAIAKNKLQAIDKILASDHALAALKFQDANGWTPLRYAIDQNNLQAIDKILASDHALAALNFIDSDGWTPLRYAIAVNKLQAIDKILASDHALAALNFIDADGWTPLRYAIAANKLQVIDKILASDHALAALKFENSNGWTPLRYAIYKCNLQAIDKILASDYALEALKFQDANGKTPLLYAIALNMQEIIDKILASDHALAALNFQDANGKTPLLHAIAVNKQEIIDKILASDHALAALNFIDSDGWTPLIYAIALNMQEIIDKILASDHALAALKFENSNGWTPLRYAIATNKLQAIDKILASDHALAALKFENSNGWTPLTYAIYKCNLQVISKIALSHPIATLYTVANFDLSWANQILIAGLKLLNNKDEHVQTSLPPHLKAYVGIELLFTQILNNVALAINHASLSPIFKNNLNAVVEKLGLTNQIKAFFYSKELNEFNAILEKYNIEEPSHVLLTDHSKFKKLLLKLHPDKGGNCDDFIAVQSIKAALDQEINIEKKIDSAIKSTIPYLYKATLGFKTVDLAIDGIKLYLEPTTQHWYKTALDCMHISQIIAANNILSNLLNVVDLGLIGNEFYQGEYTKGLLHLTASLSYKALPNILGSIGIPYIGFIYSASIAGYSGYATLSNIYSLITELNDKNAQSKYYAVYNNLYKALSTSFLNQFYDFESKYQAHQKQELELNHKNFKIEKAHFKALVESKGEFGHKLYNYVYAPYLDQKYKLLNEFIKGDLSKEEKDKLIPVLKHDITINGKHYDTCASQYYHKHSDYYNTGLSCYDEQQQIIHKIYPSVIGKQINIYALDFPID